MLQQLMQNQTAVSQTTQILVVLVRIVLFWILFSCGLWKVLGKLRPRLNSITRPWWSWIPGLRYAALGDAVDMEAEGVFCGVIELLTFAAYIINTESMSEKMQIAFSIAILVLVVILYIYRIRLFLRLTMSFGASKWWLLVWFLLEWLPMLVFGLAKQYQLVEEVKFSEEWEAGVAPAQIPGVGEAMHNRPMAKSGLSVDLRERTVRAMSRKRYLLKDIALDIPNGTMVLLLGGSGSGKTTLVNAIIGYEKADADILLNGEDVYRDYDRIKYRIGFVPQQNLIRSNDTVKRTIADSALLRLPADMSMRNRNSRISEVMDLLGLSAGADGLVAKKSGGQIRRISIAMELVSAPELFVLDEPDSGLDGVIARELFTKLRGIADEGRIVIVITHIPDRVVDLFDKVIVLAKDSGRVGRLAFYGTPQEAREFFGRDTMEGIVMSVNRKEEGGEGLADEYIERYARLTAAREEAAAT